MEYKTLNKRGTILDKEQLELYLEKLASDQIMQKNSNKNTYPIPSVKENFAVIEEVYHLLNEHIKLGIPIHPAGEWLLDNFYIIDETVKTIIREMPLKKYTNFLGIANGLDKGFARIYVLAYEIVNFTDNKIDYKNVSSFLCSYQKKKSLSMEEIWNVGIFMQIALIQSIRDICEKIYFSQMQKYRVENILEKYVEKKNELKYKNLSEYRSRVKGYGEMKYPFIEYLSYRLKNEGRSAYPFVMALEEQVNKMGTTIEEVVKKEHFDIAIKKVSMANCITSMKELLRMDFLTIFEQSNGVEEILRSDPANVYTFMDYRTKEYYRNSIKEIANKTKISEFYIASKALELAKEEFEKRENKITKQMHIGYYLIDDGINNLYEKIQVKNKKVKKSTKVCWYILLNFGITTILDIILMIMLYRKINSIFLNILIGILMWFVIEPIVIECIQYVLGKIVKPKMIPRIDLKKGIPEEYATFVVIPTILKSKEKVKELMQKLEQYYLANKSENLYFALLGDCSSGANKEEKFDKEVIEEGLKQVDILNNKYNNNLYNVENSFPKFQFVYRKRFWNGTEECYLGWERKRGLLNQFNEYLLGNIDDPFLVNTIKEVPKIKYIITLDADTELTLESGLELIGAMAHILNKPVLNKQKDCVVEGHAIMQPRVGVNIEAANKTLFTKIFAGNGGVDAYTNAISDIYQDNFQEGIFTGKGIYDLKVFSEVLYNEIPENTVLSHDLLEGNYLRCGLVSDILLMDGYPTNYNSFKTRLHRWIRGDYQINKWLLKNVTDRKQIEKTNPLNMLSRYKILDNLIRPISDIFALIAIIIGSLINNSFILSLAIISIIFPTIIEVINKIIYKKEGETYQKTFVPRLPTFLASIIRGILAIMALPDKALFSLSAIVKTIYRQTISKKHFLEWTTSEDAEKMAKTDLLSYYKNMYLNVILGVLGIIYVTFIKNQSTNLAILILSILWIIGPAVFWYISKNLKSEDIIKEISNKDKEYLLDIGKRTWEYFKDTLIPENNYLPPDNYQEERKLKFVNRTSCTNIGLALLSVVSSYDLGYENLEDTLKLLKEMLNTVENLQKWNGHLYNWYNIETLEPLIPRYISTVDSGNFVGYIYVLKEFYRTIKEKLLNGELEKDNNKIAKLISYIPEWVDKPNCDNPLTNADFTKLYDEEKGLFSIGFNIEENKLTDSYYDLLASEARQASLVAISKKDVPVKHWNKLSRTLTTMDGYNGLISWSGTAFEYLMPNVIIKQEEGSLLDESCKFMLMSQKKYAKKLGIPWGFSETAFYLKDLNNNYQYKAIGIPWLGLKRGLEEDMVVATYASMMALTEEPKEVIENIRKLEKQNMYSKYGFYESIDYTPIRMPKGSKYEVVKTYMAHHQALILLSINNLFNNKILQKRFSQNPEMSSVEILLQERMPENRIITKEEKVKPNKIKYEDYQNYAQRIYNKTNQSLPTYNVLANDNYSITMDVKGEGYSKYKNYIINRYKRLSDENQGIFFYLKNIKNKRIWTVNKMSYLPEADKYEITFSEDSDKIKRTDGSIQTTCKVAIASEKEVELRRLEIKNNGIEEETIELTMAIEPVLATLEQYTSHPAFQNLFLVYEYLEEENIFIIKRKNREDTKQGLYMAVSFYTQDNCIRRLRV